MPRLSDQGGGGGAILLKGASVHMYCTHIINQLGTRVSSQAQKKFHGEKRPASRRSITRSLFHSHGPGREVQSSTYKDHIIRLI